MSIHGEHVIGAIFVLQYLWPPQYCGHNSGLPGDLGYQFLGFYELEIGGLCNVHK